MLIIPFYVQHYKSKFVYAHYLICKLLIYKQWRFMTAMLEAKNIFPVVGISTYVRCMYLGIR